MTARGVLAAALLAAGLSAAQAQETLRFIPHADLQTLDPMGSTANIVKMHGYMIYDTLYGMDEDGVPQPQMVDTMSRSEDGKTYTFTLRDGLMWHDGTPVTSDDVVASLKRWGQRDGAGQLMMRVLSEMRTPDEKTFELEFSEPYGIVLESFSKAASNVPFILPKAVAETDAYTEIDSHVGSGPYKFVADEWIPGNKIVYEKFEDYVPRDEAANAYAGGKEVHFDRVEWLIIRDQQTALSALMSGEADFWENPSLDLLPVIEAAGIETKVVNETGIQGQMWFNHIIPPFDDKRARQAMFWLTNQETYLQAVNGNPDYYEVCPSMFPCGSPMETNVGAESLMGPDPEKAKALFEEMGWDFSTPIVVLDPTDESIAHPETVVTVQAMRDIGLAVEVQSMDWATMLTRRNSKEPADNGGWNILHSYVGGQVVATPVWSIAFSGACEKGIFGWPCDQRLEDLRLEWALAGTDADKKRIAEEFSAAAFDMGHHVPLGQWTTFVAYNADITDVPVTQDVPVFWGLKKGE